MPKTKENELIVFNAVDEELGTETTKPFNHLEAYKTVTLATLSIKLI